MLIGLFGGNSMKKKVLIMAGYYVPSIKGGGPIQSIKNLVDNLSDNIDFYIVAADRDLGDYKSFDNIEIDKWSNVGKAKVFYTNHSSLTMKKIQIIINSVDYDVIYLNSFFSYKDSIIPILLIKLKKLASKTIIIAPRGQFSPGALGLKNRKKKQFIKFAKALRLYKNIIWHATAETEKRDIEAVFGQESNIIIANNLTENYTEFAYEKETDKKKGELKIIFVSRIHPKKNLRNAIRLLNEVNGNVQFNIYGPIEDKNYWLDCKREIEGLPENIKVVYKGIVDHNDIMSIFKENHVFLFPTLGENFGHVISEALIGGCPVIISDQTPWIDLERYIAGWDINLKDEKKFKKALQLCVDLDKNGYVEMSRKAFEYGKMKSNASTIIGDYFKLFKL